MIYSFSDMRQFDTRHVVMHSICYVKQCYTRHVLLVCIEKHCDNRHVIHSFCNVRQYDTIEAIQAALCGNVST